MYRTSGILFVTLLVFSAPLFAAPPYNAWWQKANNFFQQKNYDSAAVYYEKLAASHPQNPEIYYNLGNSYYRLNRIGKAVLNYERALKLKPSYTAAGENLELTKSRIANRIQGNPEIFFVQWWKNLTAPSLAQLWAIAGLLIFIGALSMLVMRRWDRAPRWMRPQLVMVSFIVCFCTLLLAYAASARKLAHRRAVVMQQDAPLRINAKTSQIQTLIPEGTVLKIEKLQGNEVQVKLPDGRNGWMQINLLERI